MKKIFLLLLIALCFTPCIYSQIIAPDTVCVGTTVHFTTVAKATCYTWNFGPSAVSVIPTTPPPPVLQASGAPLTSPSFITMNNDNGNWYSFVTNYASNNIIKFSYGNNPANAPTLSNLGTFGITGSIYGGIDVIKDELSGNWYGFSANASNLLRLEFGTSLSNTPTSTLMTYPAHFAWPHELAIKKVGTQWIGFVANRSGAITRLDFGTSLTSPPTATNIPVVNYNAPVSFCVYNQNGNWYMLVSDLLAPAGISRFNFGPNLQNNAPTITNLGNFGGLLTITRTVRLVSGCNQLYAYVVNEYNNVYKLDFNNDITNNAPAISLVATMNTNHIFPYMYNNELRSIVMNNPYISTSTVALQTFPTGTVTNYYNPAATHTFNTPGVYEVNLWLDQGSTMAPKAYCKPIVVVSGSNTFLGPDTTLCDLASLTLQAPTTAGSPTYLWNTGATTSSITVQQGGTYWATVAGSGCGGSDTIQVNFREAPAVTATGDMRLCPGDSVRLGAGGALTYSWAPAAFLDNPGVDSPNAFPGHTMQFEVTGTDMYGCTGHDSLILTVDAPEVTATGDMTLCAGDSVRLGAGGALTYTWTPAVFLDNPGVDSPKAFPGHTMQFKVTGTDIYGCTGSDSLTLTVNIPQITTTGDMTLCAGDSVLLGAGGALTYIWTPAAFLDNPGSASPKAFPDHTMQFAVTGTDMYGCTGSDSLTLTVTPLPVVSAVTENDSISCFDATVQLHATGAVTYTWQPADLCDHPSSPSPKASPSEETVFYVTGTDQNGCSNSDSVRIRVLKKGVFFVPNAFSPNGDGLNDIFLPRINCDMQLTAFAVYNRYGEKVYTTANTGQGWNGFFKDKKADVGTYFWVIEGKSETGATIWKKGNVVLVR